MIKKTPIEKFELTLVKYPTSNIVFFIVMIVSTTIAVLTPIILKFQFGFTNLFWTILITFGSILFLFWKYGNKLYLRYKSNVSIYDDCFIVDNQKYFWREIE